ncbi:cation:proton antiporter [Streptomyces sp. MBT65]|uniref:cation:proton antiporter domain-containing protein n=1 Tax=Streptomyces sp. MBT65 TaxID=1488395 RepID=UPI001F2998B3|nr:cation:proton antiporter [Streptomyces sp. MBT65]
MDSLELIVVVAAAVLLMGRLSRRTGLSEPLLLLAAGTLVGLTPSFSSFALSPDVVLFLFLSALLYWEALTSSVREIRDNVRSIALQSTGLVLATAVAVAVVAHALGYGWPIAFVLGAVLAPTDATAVAKAMPRRILTVLRTESLLNDGTALVLLAVTVDVVTDENPFSWSGTALAFVAAYADGIAIGAAVAPAADPGEAPTAGATAAQRAERGDALPRLPPRRTPACLRCWRSSCAVWCPPGSGRVSSAPRPGSRPSPSGRWPAMCSTAPCSSSSACNSPPQYGR